MEKLKVSPIWDSWKVTFYDFFRNAYFFHFVLFNLYFLYILQALNAMELEAYETLAAYSLQEAPFYDTTNNIYDLSMSSQIGGKLAKSNNEVVKRKKKSVSFLPTFVQVSDCFAFIL